MSINFLQHKSKLDRISFTNLLTYSIIHAIVDASCSAIIASNVAIGKWNLKELSFYIVLYNILAFAFQAPLGYIVDILKKPAEAAILGCLLVLVGILSSRVVSLALIIAGIGNALFHIGGGVTVLNLKPGKASLPGIFVAPGALGLLAGTLLGKSTYYSPLIFVVLLIISPIIILIIKIPINDISYKPQEDLNKFYPILLLILTSIALRGLIGFMLNYSWKTNVLLLIAFTLAVAMGKALGGILGDYLGWTKVTILGLLFSAPFLVLGIHIPLLAILGVFLFNLTMPVTLVVTAKILPGKSGFAFGLTTLALIIGAFPTFTQFKMYFAAVNEVKILNAVLIMTFVLLFGLKQFFSENSEVTAKEVSKYEALH